ncbi:PaaX family transcriptional regulator C-terminal domain-containing protein [soil metagenome]
MPPIEPTEPPLTARSVLASTLLGTDPPRLPVAFLVRTGALFGLTEGAVRTALSRMASAGEVRTDGGGWYVLDGGLVALQLRQRQGRAAITGDWSGRWRMAVVGPGARSATERGALRAAMQRLRMAEQREGVWLRPDNLDPQRQPASSQLVDEQCRWLTVEPDLSLEQPDDELAAQLGDLDGWATRAVELRRSMHELTPALERRDTDALAPGFFVSAAVLRHFGADPLLPRELLGRNWPGSSLRVDYDRYDRAYREVLAGWVGSSVPGVDPAEIVTAVVPADGP